MGGVKADQYDDNISTFNSISYGEVFDLTDVDVVGNPKAVYCVPITWINDNHISNDEKAAPYGCQRCKVVKEHEGKVMISCHCACEHQKDGSDNYKNLTIFLGNEKDLKNPNLAICLVQHKSQVYNVAGLLLYQKDYYANYLTSAFLNDGPLKGFFFRASQKEHYLDSKNKKAKKGSQRIVVYDENGNPFGNKNYDGGVSSEGVPSGNAFGEIHRLFDPSLKNANPQKIGHYKMTK